MFIVCSTVVQCLRMFSLFFQSQDGGQVCQSQLMQEPINIADSNQQQPMQSNVSVLQYRGGPFWPH